MTYCTVGFGNRLLSRTQYYVPYFSIHELLYPNEDKCWVHIKSKDGSTAKKRARFNHGHK